MRNSSTKARLVSLGIRQYELAEQLNVSVSTLTRMLRRVLTKEEKEAIRCAIEAIRQNQNRKANF